jgi:threonylcarbamoyladenosine tRNA methylthiotransferase MtaB
VATYRIVNLGCKVNRVEADDFERAFVATGLGCAKDGEGASVVVVNTCTVTGEAEKKTRKAIRAALNSNEDAQVVVTGCAAAINPDEILALDPRVKIIPKHKVEDFISTLDVGSVATQDGGEVPHGRSRAGLKIQDGCDNACTYCIVCKARGASVSVESSKVVERARQIALEGHREIVLSGINLGAYYDEGMALDGLLVELLEATKNIVEPGNARDVYPARFRISSIEPKNISPALIELIAQSKGRVCRHLHIPLQSGSGRVLREMARNYTIDEYLSLIEDLRAAVPQISISTDIIVGFPGETEQDFNDTLKVARICGFSKIHVFPYSKRAGTLAAARSDQVESQVKSARAASLRLQASELRRADEARRAGQIERFCIQENGRMTSESYYERAVPDTFRMTNDCIGKLFEFAM